MDFGYVILQIYAAGCWPNQRGALGKQSLGIHRFGQIRAAHAAGVLARIVGANLQLACNCGAAVVADTAKNGALGSYGRLRSRRRGRGLVFCLGQRQDGANYSRVQAGGLLFKYHNVAGVAGYALEDKLVNQSLGKAGHGAAY